MKILFDTNVILSGFIARGGYSAEVIQDVLQNHEIYYTVYILEELKRTLKNKFSFSEHSINLATSTIKKHYIKGETAKNTHKICRDKNDDQVLADAILNNIDLLITGDKDLLVLKEYQNIKIISPREYWSLQQ